MIKIIFEGILLFLSLMISVSYILKLIVKIKYSVGEEEQLKFEAITTFFLWSLFYVIKNL